MLACFASSTNQLESVQRRFTKRLTGLRCLSYDERLTVRDLERVELRRIYADPTVCYKIVYGLVNILFDAFSKFAHSCSTRGHPLKLLYPDATINARAHSFPVRAVTLWYRLPAATVLATNLQTFKTSVTPPTAKR